MPRTSTQPKPSKSSNSLFERLLQGRVVQKAKVNSKSELVIYLAEPRENGVLDKLEWWNNNLNRFPILSKMARDYLAIQLSSTNSKREFCTGGLVCNKLRNRLHPDTMRYLICLRSWFKIKEYLDENKNVSKISSK